MPPAVVRAAFRREPHASEPVRTSNPETTTLICAGHPIPRNCSAPSRTLGMMSMKFRRTALLLALLGASFAAGGTITPAHAQASRTFVSAAGSDTNPCSFTLPCHTWTGALPKTLAGGEIEALDEGGFGNVTITKAITLEAGPTLAGVATAGTDGVTIQAGASDVVNLRGLVINGLNASSLDGINVKSAGRVGIMNCVIEEMGTGSAQYGGVTVANSSPVDVTITDSKIVDNSAYGLNLVPSADVKLAIRNTLISGNTAGGLVQPGAGADVSATFDRVTLIQNAGGGLRSDATNGGTVTLDVSGSTISANGGGGINAVSSGSQNMISIGSSVIAKNAVGVQANGASAAALIDTTLLDSNAGGALSAVNGGRILSYGTNRIVGSAGTGFSSSTALQ